LIAAVGGEINNRMPALFSIRQPHNLGGDFDARQSWAIEANAWEVVIYYKGSAAATAMPVSLC